MDAPLPVGPLCLPPLNPCIQNRQRRSNTNPVRRHHAEERHVCDGGGGANLCTYHPQSPVYRRANEGEEWERRHAAGEPDLAVRADGGAAWERGSDDRGARPERGCADRGARLGMGDAPAKAPGRIGGGCSLGEEDERRMRLEEIRYRSGARPFAVSYAS
jgi:hypothetical protein